MEPFLLADIGEGINEVEIKEWQVKVGDRVKEFDPICEVESDKATATISSRFDGVITKIYYEVGQLAKVGKPLVDIEMISKNSYPETESVQESRTQAPQEVPKAREGGINFSMSRNQSISTLPSIRRIASQNNIDLSQVEPTGRNGRITKEDLDLYMRGMKGGTGTAPNGREPLSESSYAPSAQVTQLETRIPMKSIQRAMYKTMTESLKIPHFNYSDEIDMTRLVEAAKVRNQHVAENRETEKIGNFAFFVKMVSLALQSYPQLNASIDKESDCMILKNYHNIGIAIDTPDGLTVPNVKNVQNLSIRQINSEMLRLRDLAYKSKLTFDDLNGGTISLSNIGAIGGVFGVPVIVPPEIVIGALGKTRLLPRFDCKGNVEARHTMQVVWSADHRVVDGATLCRFSNLLKYYLEQPEYALVELS